jgi:cell division protein FtsQ
MRLRYKLACVGVALLSAYAVWVAVLRSLPLFQVQSVTVTGLSGDAAPQIRSALELTAREMTTTDVSVARLRAAVANYTLVADLRVTSDLPHGLHIRVIERRPFVRLDVDRVIVAVSRDDRVLAGLAPSRHLPLLRSTRAPVGGTVSDPLTLEEIALLAAAPEPVLAHVYSVALGSEGLTVQLRDGPAIYFGDDTLPHAKWESAAVVLAEPTAHGASYIDVSLPSRPAAQVDDPATRASSTPASGSTMTAVATNPMQPVASGSTSG